MFAETLKESGRGIVISFLECSFVVSAVSIMFALPGSEDPHTHL